MRKRRKASFFAFDGNPKCGVFFVPAIILLAVLLTPSKGQPAARRS